MPRRKKAEKFTAAPLPDKDSSDYFNALVQNCVKAYEKLNNDSLALDFCKVSDKRLRALILDDEEYKRETKSIYARQRLEEVQELEYLASLAADEGVDEDDEDGEYLHPSERGKKKAGKGVSIDKDRLNMRFKAAQMKREIMKEMADTVGDVERDTVNLMYIRIERDEFERLLTFELREGSDDAGLDALVGKKEEVPVGTSGRLRTGSAMRTETDIDDGSLDFEVLPNGEIVER